MPLVCPPPIAPPALSTPPPTPPPLCLPPDGPRLDGTAVAADKSALSPTPPEDMELTGGVEIRSWRKAPPGEDVPVLPVSGAEPGVPPGLGLGREAMGGLPFPGDVF